MNQISRAYGDESPIRVTFTNLTGVSLTDVDSAEMRVYDGAEISTATLLATLDGEIRGFDPATYFPVGDGNGNWTGTRYYTIVLIRGSIETVLPVRQWVQS